MNNYLEETRLFQASAPEILVNEFIEIIIFENERVLAVNKPGWLVCHPSKNGPGSSLVGAAKRYLQTERIHLVSRLDRETSGIVVFAKDRGAARVIQMAVEARRVAKSYTAVLDGRMDQPTKVEARIIADKTSEVRVKMRSHESEKDPNIRTRFDPLSHNAAGTVCRVTTEGGRKHQIRVHAAHIGHPLVGDKLYGPDESLYLEFCREGWTPRLAANLHFHRQALHCGEWSLENDLGIPDLLVPPPADFEALIEGTLH